MENTEVGIVSQKIKNLALQDYLSIGYMFLLVLGVLHETIYYKFLGVNILEYSSVLDVLISPIAVMGGNLTLAIAVIITILFANFYFWLTPKYFNYLSKKKKYEEGLNKLKLEKYQEMFKNQNRKFLLMAFFVISLFIGLGVGRGQKTKERIETNNIKMTHQIHFERGGKQKINMFGKNSLYIFYVGAGMEEVSIAPIQGNIRLIQKLRKKSETPSHPEKPE